MKRVKRASTHRQKQPFGTVYADIPGNASAKFINRFAYPFGSGPGHAIGTSVTGTFSPQEILYHKLEIDDALDYDYIDPSGIYNTTGTNPADLGAFLDAYDDDHTLSNLSGTGVSRTGNLYNPSGAPDIQVRKQCYIVIDLACPADMAFRAGVPAIDTVNDCTPYYYNLVHWGADDEPAVPPTSAPSATTGLSCLLFYLSAENPYFWQARGDDQFNLYLQRNKPSGIALITVDPHIKNRGGPPPSSPLSVKKRSA